MVENPVQHHPHAHGVGIVYQRFQRRVAAKHGIHVLIVHGVVLVVAGGAKDRGHIQQTNPQLPQVGQLLPDAHQVAAVEALGGGLDAPGVGQVAPILGRAAVPEPLGEDLVGGSG